MTNASSLVQFILQLWGQRFMWWAGSVVSWRKRKISEQNKICVGIAPGMPPMLRALAPSFQWKDKAANVANMPT